jgi:hypothetical protein
MGFAETNANSRNKCKFLQMAIINHFKRAVLVQIPETQDFLEKTAIHSYIWAETPKTWAGRSDHRQELFCLLGRPNSTHSAMGWT